MPRRSRTTRNESEQEQEQMKDDPFKSDENISHKQVKKKNL